MSSEPPQPQQPRSDEVPNPNPIAFKPIIHTPRLTLTLYDPSSSIQTSHILSCYNTATAHAEMGDFRLRTPEQLTTYLSTNVLLHPKDLSPSSPFLSSSSSSSSSSPSTDSPIYIIRLGGGSPNPTTPTTPDDSTKNTLIGFIALASVEADAGISPQFKGRPHMGWLMSDEKFMGKGYATEAAAAARDYWGSEELVGTPIRSTIRVGNRGSERVAEKLGMRKIEKEDGGEEVRDGGEVRGEWVWEG